MNPDLLSRALAWTMSADGMREAMLSVAELPPGLRIIVWRGACRLAGIAVSVRFVDGVQVIMGA